MNATANKLSTPPHHLLRTALLALLLGASACNKSAPSAPAPAKSAEASALVGQWRNMNGTWRFESWGTFWYDGGTTIQMNPSGMNIPKSDVLAGKYEVHGTTLHLILKQHTPPEKDCTFQIDGQKLTIDGVVYDKQ